MASFFWIVQGFKFRLFLKGLFSVDVCFYRGVTNLK